MVVINQHNWLNGVGDRCVYCGTVCRADGTSPLSCVDRPALPEVTGATTWRSAVDDADAITARLAELAAERQAALNTPAEMAVPAMDYTDCCVG